MSTSRRRAFTVFANSVSRLVPFVMSVCCCQVPAEVQGSWKALRALCWCDDELARVASRHWLQQLLAVTLQQSLKVREEATAP
jgi:hypothetical protein